MSHTDYWTLERDERLRYLWVHEPDSERIQAEFADKQWGAIVQKARRLGVKRLGGGRYNRKPGIYWTKERNELLIKLWKTCRDMNRIRAAFPEATPNSLKHQASRLGAVRLSEAVGPPELPSLALVPEFAAWLAGMIDAEGYVALRAGKPDTSTAEIKYFQPIVAISNNHKPALERIRAEVGFGRIVKRLTEPGHPNYLWFTGRQTQVWALIEVVSPYLRIKDQQAVLVTEWQDMLWATPGRNRDRCFEEQLEIYNQLRRLNATGVETGDPDSDLHATIDLLALDDQTDMRDEEL